MKKQLVAALIALAAPALLVTPAGAAVPKTKANRTVPCNDGTGRSARVWAISSDGTFSRLAADNRCAEWLLLDMDSGDGTESTAIALAPGAHFNRHVRIGGLWLGARLDGDGSSICEDFDHAYYIKAKDHGNLRNGRLAPQC